MGLDVLVVMPTGGKAGFYSNWRSGAVWEKFHTSKLPRCWPAATGPAAGRGIHGWPRCIGLCSPASWDVHRGRVLQWDRPHPTLAGLPRLTDIRLLRVGRGSKSTLLRSSSCGLLLGPERWAGTRRRRLRSMASDSDCSRSSSSVPLARLAPHTGGKRLPDARGAPNPVSGHSASRSPCPHDLLGRSTRSTTRHRRVWPDVTA
jgi:hypothetical protein